ncbi:MAG: leucine-rich repeat protein [Clostridia bacterium]|nr:leucine-rich repeat protein [Clostridia bacterium]
MEISITCEKCGNEILVDLDDLKKTSHCPHCNTPLVEEKNEGDISAGRFPKEFRVVGATLVGYEGTEQVVDIPEGIKELHGRGYVGIFAPDTKTIRIPDSVCRIEGNPFYGCGRLKYNEYDNALYLGNERHPYLVLVKAKSQSVTSCVIHEQTKIICEEAFRQCDKLKEIEFPQGLLQIGKQAFEYCRLGTIEIPASVREIGKSAIDCKEATVHSAVKLESSSSVKTKYNEYENGCYLGDEENPYRILVRVAPKYDRNHKSVKVKFLRSHERTEILAGGFYGDEHLETLELTDGIKEIGSMAFYGNERLKTVRLPAKLETIGTYAFSHCENLKELLLPDTVRSIGDGAFQYCAKLKRLDVPKGATLGHYLFNYCIRLREASLPCGTNGVGDLFWNCKNLRKLKLFGKGILKSGFVFGVEFAPKKLETVELDDGFTEIAPNAFWGCKSLKNIRLPDSVKVIGSDAFRDCVSLKLVDLPSGVERIESGAFYGCKRLSRCSLGNRLRVLYLNAFEGCRSLHSVRFPKTLRYISPSIMCSTKLRKVYFDEPNGWYRRWGNEDEPIDAESLQEPRKAARVLRRLFVDCFVRKDGE